MEMRHEWLVIEEFKTYGISEGQKRINLNTWVFWKHLDLVDIEIHDKIFAPPFEVN